MKKTQIMFVLEKLAKDGEVSRNYCLKNYLSRLGAIIAELKMMGIKFKNEWRPSFKGWEGHDYFYFCDNKVALKELKKLKNEKL